MMVVRMMINCPPFRALQWTNFSMGLIKYRITTRRNAKSGEKGLLKKIFSCRKIWYFSSFKCVFMLYAAAHPPKTREAIGLLYQASYAGHVRAQYQLALCLHQGRGVRRSLPEAVYSHLFYFNFWCMHIILQAVGRKVIDHLVHVNWGNLFFVSWSIYGIYTFLGHSRAYSKQDGFSNASVRDWRFSFPRTVNLGLLVPKSSRGGIRSCNVQHVSLLLDGWRFKSVSQIG